MYLATKYEKAHSRPDPGKSEGVLDVFHIVNREGDVEAQTLVEAVGASLKGGDGLTVAEDYQSWIQTVKNDPANPLYTLSRWFESGLPQRPRFRTRRQGWAADEKGRGATWPEVGVESIQAHLAWLEAGGVN